MTAQEGRIARESRAAELIAAGAYLVTRGAVLVYSDQPGVVGHTVVNGRCDCQDANVGFAFRNGLMCKHQLVASAVLRARMVIARRPDVARRIAEAA